MAGMRHWRLVGASDRIAQGESPTRTSAARPIRSKPAPVTVSVAPPPTEPAEAERVSMAGSIRMMTSSATSAAPTPDTTALMPNSPSGIEPTVQVIMVELALITGHGTVPMCTFAGTAKSVPMRPRVMPSYPEDDVSDVTLGAGECIKARDIVLPKGEVRLTLAIPSGCGPVMQQTCVLLTLSRAQAASPILTAFVSASRCPLMQSRSPPAAEPETASSASSRGALEEPRRVYADSIRLDSTSSSLSSRMDTSTAASTSSGREASCAAVVVQTS